MAQSGWADLVQASEIVFDQSKASQYFLQAHPDDITTVMIFNNDVSGGPWTVKGNDPAQMLSLYNNIKAHQPEDGTNMYSCLNKSLELFGENKGDNRKRLIILMTDGKSITDGDKEFRDGEAALGKVPVVSIVFGEADKSQLSDLASQTGGNVVDKDSLVEALREATGYK
jgi:hypothetical protein